jgi:hypothetical protein
MLQTGNDLLAALDNLVDGWSSDDGQRSNAILEHRNEHVPMDVPMKKPAIARVSDVFGTIRTLEHKEIGDTTRDNLDSDPNESLTGFSDSKLDFPENHVPMFQLFQKSQKNILHQWVNHWNNTWNMPVPTFQNGVRSLLVLGRRGQSCRLLLPAAMLMNDAHGWETACAARFPAVITCSGPRT